jgi:hypothetical protein
MIANGLREVEERSRGIKKNRFNTHYDLTV